jgi:hypothetical protein
MGYKQIFLSSLHTLSLSENKYSKYVSPQCLVHFSKEVPDKRKRNVHTLQELM